jgi:IclR family acetate operon transcriptional repressor
MNQPEKGDSVRAVGRALEILLAFTPQDFELSAAELLTRVDLSRPTLYRLLYSLEEHGFIQSVGDPQRFRLGPAVAKLAHVWTSSLDLSVVADPILRRIWAQTSETVALFVPQGELRLCIAELPSPQPLNFKRGIGYTERIVRGATGRAILAFMDVAPRELREWAAGTGIDVAELESELARTRKRGFATSHSELIAGAIAVAAPFFDRRGEVAGSVGVYGPEVRLNAARQKEVAQSLMKEADALSQALGFSKEDKART